MYKKILKIVLILLVFVYIIFEELIWEKFAKPIISFITKQQLFKNLIPKILNLNSYFILIFFVSIFVIVETIGAYAGLLFISGHIFIATLIYILKIPVAAFIFWFFNIVKPKLLEFKWFNFVYENLILAIYKIKNSSIYIMIKEKVADYKKVLKDNGFLSKGKIKHKIMGLYKIIKHKITKIKY